MSNHGVMQEQLSQQDFAALGVESFAYIKPIELVGENEDGKEATMPAFAICSADGTQMGVAASHDAAFAAVRQHGLEPLSLH